MKTKIRKQEFLFTLPLLNRKNTSIDRLLCVVSKHPLRLYMQTWQIFGFFSMSAVDPKYCLLAVDLFTSKTFVYPIKSRNFLSWKLELFYRGIQPKREQITKNKNMRLQKDLEFRQNEIKKLSKKYNIEMFSSHVRGGKAYVNEQKIREFKKFLCRSKWLHKLSSAKRFDSRKLICMAAENMNSINSQKYGNAPNAIEEKPVESERFREIYDFYGLVKVKQHA